MRRTDGGSDHESVFDSTLFPVPILYRKSARSAVESGLGSLKKTIEEAKRDSRIVDEN